MTLSTEQQAKLDAIRAANRAQQERLEEIRGRNPNRPKTPERPPQAATSPKCEQPNENDTHLSGAQVIYLIFGGLMVWWFAGGGLDKQAAHEMQKIENQVATDAVDRYQIAKREGNAIQVCVQAGFVSAAYLQAKDEANYRQWKETESNDCQRAGLPR